MASAESRARMPSGAFQRASDTSGAYKGDGSHCFSFRGRPRFRKLCSRPQAAAVRACRGNGIRNRSRMLLGGVRGAKRDRCAFHRLARGANRANPSPPPPPLPRHPACPPNPPGLSRPACPPRHPQSRLLLPFVPPCLNALVPAKKIPFFGQIPPPATNTLWIAARPPLLLLFGGDVL